MSSAIHSCLYLRAASWALSPRLVRKAPLAVAAGLLSRLGLADLKARLEGAQELAAALVASQPLGGAVQLVAQRLQDGFPSQGAGAGLLLVQAKDAAAAWAATLLTFSGAGSWARLRGGRTSRRRPARKKA